MKKSKKFFIISFVVLLIILLIRVYFFSFDNYKKEVKEERYVKYAFLENDLYGVLFNNGDVAINPSYDKIFTLVDGKIRAEKDGMSYLLNIYGDVIAGELKKVLPFNDGYSAVMCNNDKWGFINEKGCFLISCKFEAAKSFSENLAAVQNNGKWGFINKEEEAVIPFRYDSVESFSGNLATVMKDGVYCGINKHGEKITPCEYDFLKPYKGFFVGKMDGKEQNHVVLSESGEEAYSSSSEIRPLDIGENIYALNFFSPPLIKDGKIILGEKEFDRIYKFQEKRALFRKKEDGVEKYGFIDENGKVIVPPLYDEASSFYEGRSIVKMGDKYGVLDLNGKNLVPLEYDRIHLHSSEEIASLKSGKVKIHTKENIEGRAIFKCDDIISGRESFLIVEKDGKQGVIDNEGNIVVDFKEIKIFFAGEVFSYLADNGMWGYLSRNGKEITPPVFDKVCGFMDGVGKVFKGENIYNIDLDGKQIFDGKYSSVRRLDWKDFYACGMRSSNFGIW